MISKKKKSSPKFNDFFGQNQKFKGFFRPKSGDLQKKVFAEIQRLSWPESEIWRFFPAKIRWSSKKKSLRRLWVRSRTKKTPLFWSKWRHVLHNFGSQIPLGGAVFIFVTKIGLKSTKNVLFCILFRPMEGARAPLSPPTATLLCDYAISFCYRSLKIF